MANTTTTTPVTLIRTAFDKEAFDATVNTEFTELGVAEVDLSFFDPNLATTEDFFNIYNNLFFLIPKTGVNSHTTLITESSDYVGYEANQEEIQALLQEIAELRELNLELQIDQGEILKAQQGLERIDRLVNS
tara:strand:+ start:432 stop:830 length:399 start_codon:yes stop_codon:yes gene_type:complete